MSAVAFSRRAWLKSTAVLAAAASVPRWLSAGEEPPTVPVRTITRGPKFHWFGYYDKLQFDPTDRYVLGMEIGFEGRSPKPDDTVKLGMVDLHEQDRWIEFGETQAWCWQQGCMLQWLPGSKSEVIYNGRQGDAYVSHVLDVFSGQRRTIPHPIYAVSPDGRWAVATDFRRLGDMRPGYGYNGIADPNADQLAPANAGVWRVDLQSGKQDLLISYADAAKIPFPHGDVTGAKHWFNHLLVNPDGTRFEFLHRWAMPNGKGWRTRMFTAAPDGSDLRVVDDNGATSHFIWRDPRHILAWSQYERPGGFFLFEDRAGGKVEKVLMTVDGHCSYLPGGQWFVCDTYPQRDRAQEVYLYHVPTNRKVVLGRFLSPKAYSGEWRCDTHPRISRDGGWVCIDSPHAGGRQLHLIDLRGVAGKGGGKPG